MFLSCVKRHPDLTLRRHEELTRGLAPRLDWGWGACKPSGLIMQLSERLGRPLARF